MKLWPFKRKDPPPQPAWMARTPIANMVEEMFNGGYSSSDIIWNVRLTEMEQVLQRDRLDELHRLATANAAMVHKRVPKPRVIKPRVVTRNQRTPKKRNRANYMRHYRAKLRVVTRDGDAA